MIDKIRFFLKKMRNKVDVFSEYGDKANVYPNRKLIYTTDPIPQSETINVERWLKMFLLLTSDMKDIFSGSLIIIIIKKNFFFVVVD